MFKKIIFLIINSFWVLLCLRQYLSFKKAISNVESIQQKLLLRTLRKNAQSEFGRKHGFSSISNTSEFQAKVPISTYDSYLPYINSIGNGKKNVLTGEPILMLEPSSGSTAPSKYIPYTRSLKQEFQKGISPWIFNLYSHCKKLLFGKAYWSITPVAHSQRKTEGRLPIGFEDDSEYLGFLGKYLLNLLFVVPKEVIRIEDIAAFQYTTLLFLLIERDITLISVWNPAFLTLLLAPMKDWLPSLIKDIREGTISPPGNIDPVLKDRLATKLSKNRRRAKELALILMQLEELGDAFYEKIWPNLALISCWCDANATLYIKEVKKLFKNVEIQPKGLIATEGFISFPLVNESGAPLSIESHFFEFIEINGGDKHSTKLAHQLEKGKRYSVIITTGGGLYRYRLFDIIEVVGFKGECPLIRFIGKEDKISDLFGEKLNEQHISCLLKELFKKYSIMPKFFMIAPEKCEQSNTCFYVLFLELALNLPAQKLDRLALELEERLQENYHYKYCRELGQLSKSRLFIIHSGGSEVYLRQCQSLDQRAGDIKPAVLHPKFGWAKEFDAVQLEFRA